MAKRLPLIIDAEFKEVAANAPLASLVSAPVQSVVTHAGKIIPRQAFAQYRAQDIPSGFDTQHASINKAWSRDAAE